MRIRNRTLTLADLLIFLASQLAMPVNDPLRAATEALWRLWQMLWQIVERDASSAFRVRTATAIPAESLARFNLANRCN